MVSLPVNVHSRWIDVVFLFSRSVSHARAWPNASRVIYICNSSRIKNSSALICLFRVRKRVKISKLVKTSRSFSAQSFYTCMKVAILILL